MIKKIAIFLLIYTGAVLIGKDYMFLAIPLLALGGFFLGFWLDVREWSKHKENNNGR